MKDKSLEVIWVFDEQRNFIGALSLASGGNNFIFQLKIFDNVVEWMFK